MSELLSGVPMQVHLMRVAVVLIPLSAIGAALIAARPKALHLFGGKTVIAAAVGVVAGVISGMLRKGLGQDATWSGNYVEYRNIFPIAALVFLFLLTIFWLIARGVPLNRNRPLWLKVIGATLIWAGIGISYLTVAATYLD
ncbi:MAG TPA: hypothetical protein DDZ31_05020 [Actinobacteria bacterium]|nr:hypothetical protein [Actinomycetota bacterium]